ncbi:MAG TPA: cation diffusion facilitator family transporter [Gemmatimonadales bacterium]|nr:cation diffusion facilitator family transporter [Gemmatimonadales bacterium]
MTGPRTSAGPSVAAKALRADCISLTASRPAVPLSRLALVLSLTLAFMLVEVVGGWLSGSLALLADAGHMLTDAGALGLSLLSAWVAGRPANDSKTYGYQRWEILAALINGAALFGIAAWVMVEAIQRIQNPEPIRAQLFLIVAAAGLVVNLVSLRLLHSMRHGSLNVRGAYLHVLGDAFGSAGALGAAAVVALTGWTLADPIISIALALLILIGAWRLLRESTDILLESVPGHVSLLEVQRCMLAVSGVTGVHDLHVWTVTSGMVAMSGHAIVPELASHPEVLEGIRVQMARLGIVHVTIQLEVQHECEEPVVVAAHGGHGHHQHGHGH